MAWSVLVLDMARYQDEEGERTVGGFESFEAARDYARGRVAGSLAELHKPGQAAAELRALWLRFGEDAIVPGEPGYKASAELDEMIARLAGTE